MFYPNLKFPQIKGKPFFYTNFVSTVDGKVGVKREGYWPIGSRLDHQVLMELRSYADCLLHGKNLANQFGDITRKSLQNKLFKNMRQKLGKDPNLSYLTVATRDLKSLSNELYNKGYSHILVEGGPTLLASFLKANLIDEIFLTIAPKIFGSEPNITLTPVEGYLFPKKATKNLSLISVKKAGNELYLRYKAKE